MKRSDFIARLQLRFSWLPLQKAEKLLDFIEELGMQPPRVSNEDFQALARIYVEPHVYWWDEDLEKIEKIKETKDTLLAWKIEREERNK